MAVGSAIGGPLLGTGRGSTYRYRHRMGIIPSAEFVVFHDDFVTKVTSNVPDGWDAAVIDLGATVTQETATTSSARGILLFDSDGTQEGAAIYTPKAFALQSGKRFFMELRAKTDSVNSSDLQFGLSDLTATTNPEDLWTTTAANVVAFGILDGSATVKMLSDRANSGSAVQTGTMSLSADVWHTLAIYYNGNSILQGYVDGNLALTWSGAAATTIPIVNMAAFIGFRNGGSVDTEGRIDYLRIVAER